MKIAPLLAVLMAAVTSRAAAENIVIHEWGTFTSLQNERGEAIGGINTDDEPVPAFVHDIAGELLIPASEFPHTLFSQGAPACHPDVTMRLETPVLYVHASDSFTGTLNVRVAFNGGWLTQYYPAATAKATGLHPLTAAWHEFGQITEKTASTLTWPSVKVEPTDSKIAGPKTEDPVWLAPGKVDARMLTADGESERFLFYRGVGHLDAPLKVTRNEEGAFTVDWQTTPLDGEMLQKFWLLDVRKDGSAACQIVSGIGTPGGIITITVKPSFKPEEYHPKNIAAIRNELKEAVIADGLHADEAEALLNTWELSYFKSSGLRLFFLVPRTWTERHLPLAVSLSDGKPVTDITRVIVGRIELVSPEQRALLKIIGKGPVPHPRKDIWLKAHNATREKGDNIAWQDLVSGSRTFESLGIELPAVFRAYLDLGRFRDALILDELKRAPTPELTEFAKTFKIESYKSR